MTSMAAALAASLPAAVVPTQKIDKAETKNQSAQVPQRLEGLIDPEGSKAVESVQVSSLVLLKVLKHSTDALPPAPSSNVQQDRNPPPTTALSSRPDAIGVLLGLDLDGVMEIEDCFALPGGETGVGRTSYTSQLLPFLRDVSTPDSPIGIYLSTRNGGFVTRPVLDLLLAVEQASERGKAILIIHDATKGVEANELSVKGYTLSEGALKVAKEGKWDSASLMETRLTAANLLTPLPLSLSSPSLISAFLSTLPASAPSSLSTPPAPSALPTQFTPLLSNSSLTAYLSDTLDSLTLNHAESNNVAFLQRQIAREKTKYEGQVREREEENVKRRKQGLTELPSLPKYREVKDPNRVELVCLQGQLDALGKGMAAEAGRGLVRCYL